MFPLLNSPYKFMQSINFFVLVGSIFQIFVFIIERLSGMSYTDFRKGKKTDFSLLLWDVNLVHVRR